jgi:hypothetical protein
MRCVEIEDDISGIFPFIVIVSPIVKLFIVNILLATSVLFVILIVPAELAVIIISG